MKRTLLHVFALGLLISSSPAAWAQTGSLSEQAGQGGGAESSTPNSSTGLPPSADAPAPPARVFKTVPVVLETDVGPVTIELEVERAPLTAGNFLRYVEEKRFDGTVFYRSFRWDDGTPGGFIQGGTQNDPKRILKPVPHESTKQTGLSHLVGTISLAQGGPGTGTGDFFIIIGDLTGFDATEDQPGFAAFGKVIAGMDVIRAISAAPRSPRAGEGVMKGQMLDPVIRIRTARRLAGS